MIDDAAKIHDSSLKTKVAIVGSGAAGAILSYKLSQAGIDCLVLEEGKEFNRKSLAKRPKEVASQVYRDSCFFATLGKPIIPVPMGKALGGTTVINSGTCFRTPKEKLESWQNDLGLSDLKTEEFEASFDFIENLIGVEYAREKIMGSGNLKFKHGLENMGLKGAPLLRNTKGCDGCGFCCYGCPSQAKQSMDVSVIPKASHAGAKYLVNAKVTKIHRKGSKITALTVQTKSETDGKKRNIIIEADTFIISAGAIYSPSLLLKSGIKLKNVGRYLTIHPTTKVLALFEEKMQSWRGIPQAYGYEGMKDEGITYEGVFLPPDVIGAMLPCESAYEEIIENYDKVGAFGALIHDSRYGRVRHFPGLGTKAFYSLTDQDVNKFKKAIAFMAKVYLKAGAKKVYTLINHKDNMIQSESDVERFLNLNLKNTDIETMGFHPLGTCRMGLTKKDSVVDQNCKVHDIDNLYVCDGSVVPTHLGVNPQITIMSFANRLGDYLTKSFPLPN